VSYGPFSYIYDRLMSHAPYGKWLEYVRKEKSRFQVSGSRLLDLACGTGELSIRLIEEGFQVTGVDLSDSMLAVAAIKASEKGVSLPLFQQDMSRLEGLQTFDIVTIFCDSLNYLPSENEVRETFRRVHGHLDDGGLFLFDVHSIFQMTHGFANRTFTYNEEEIAYIWQSYPGKARYSVDHELTFFVLDDMTGQYERIDERHHQRTFPAEQYAAWLEKAGFRILRVTADFTDDPPLETSKRIFFTCQKTSGK
jgi:SAM-dependent methyltransferase